MSTLTRNLIRTSLRIGIIATMILPAIAVAMNVPTLHAQTAQRTMNGFEVAGRFLNVWSKQGNERDSVYVNGLPITARRSEISVDDGRAYDTQWFERARYEAHPENPAPADVLLGRLGASRIEGRGKVDPSTGKVVNPSDAPFAPVSRPPDADGKAKTWFAETGHSLSGKFFDYWQKYGGLPQFGFPLSEPFQETSQTDGKLYTVQYFERNRFELHPENSAPYDVALGLLGVEQYRMTAVPAASLPIAPPADTQTVRDEVRIGMSQQPSTLSMFSASQLAYKVRSLIEDGLVGRDDNGNLFPLDAWYVPTLENGGASFVGDGEDRYLRVKYKLRQGIKWSDGVELTSNDALFAYKLTMNPDAPVADRSEYTRLQSVVSADRYTVIYNYRSSKQAAAFLNSRPDKDNFSYLQPFVTGKKPVISGSYSTVGAIYPEHILSKIPPARLLSDPVSLAPIGTGPYKVAQWVAGSQIVLSPNNNYNLTARPLIKTVVLKFIGDPSAFLPEIQTRDVDMLTGDAFALPPASASDLKAKGLVLSSRPSATWDRIEFSWDYSIFKDRAVREAIFRAVNRQALLDKAYRGGGALMNSVAPPNSYYSLDNPDFAKNYPDIAAKYKLPLYPYDPKLAQQILDAAGWTVRPDGIRGKEGIRLSFEYGTITDAVSRSVQAQVAEDLKAIGIEVKLRAYPAGVFDDAEGPKETGVTKLAQWPSTIAGKNDFSQWLCRPADPSGQALQRYCNPAVDDANNRFTTSLDNKTLVAAAAQAQAALMQDLVIIPLVQRPNVQLASETLVNFKPTNSLATEFWNTRQWYFK